jgi:glycosyltransferase XagB
MQTDRLARFVAEPRMRPPVRDARLLGRILQDMGAISQGDLDHALALQRRIDAQLGDIFVAEGLITQAQLQQALAQQHGLSVADLVATPPDPSLREVLSPDLCLRHLVVPWRHFGDILLVATAHPDRFDALMAERGPSRLAVLPVLAESDAIRDCIGSMHETALAAHAEFRVAPEMSCRNWSRNALARGLAAVLLVAGLASGLWFAPAAVFSVLAWTALVTLGLSMSMKLAAATAQLWAELRAPKDPPLANVTPIRLPRVSVMVPLLREREIAGALIRRLSRLTYPKALLDIVLVLEEEDEITRGTLARTDLPPWMRVIEVPAAGSGLTTKPRALNYALDFCRGGIVGIWDAEDEPEPDQIEQVVNHFNQAAPEVVCLQGRLDYYNSRVNWISRCFTIEYATWWRLIMPGLARLGFVIPLGGTTLFFRRKELEELGGWDAHNVTEDADLGLRLARAGYRTELISTVTREEANCHVWPWIRQRSRWLKGFAITWAVHMRQPRRLCRELGLFRFLGLQVFFLSALSQFILAPVFWTFFAGFLGFGFLQGSPAGNINIMLFLLGCELATLLIHIAAVRRPEHRHLMGWTPSMMFYVQMGCIAMYKALYELILRPFFWDKTRHGVTSSTETAPV